MKLKINIDSKQYEVDVEVADVEVAGHARLQATESAAVRAPIAVAAPPVAVSTVAEAKVCRSPVSGIVASVAAQPGQTLQVGDVLLVLEAMKMETQVTAHVAGKVAAVLTKAGDSVHSGQVLVEFE